MGRKAQDCTRGGERGDRSKIPHKSTRQKNTTSVVHRLCYVLMIFPQDNAIWKPLVLRIQTILNRCPRQLTYIQKGFDPRRKRVRITQILQSSKESTGKTVSTNCWVLVPVVFPDWHAAIGHIIMSMNGRPFAMHKHMKLHEITLQ